MMGGPEERIIVPLDVGTELEAIALMDRLPQVQFWKVGLELFVSVGPKILEELRGRGKRIFLDLKFHDIPNTMGGACGAAAVYGVDLLTVHGTAGKAALLAAQDAARNAVVQKAGGPKLLAVTVLTSLSGRSLALELKIPLEVSDYALQLALMAQECGLAGAVCSPQEVRQLRMVCQPGFLLVCPGVRPDWAERGDQQRTLTPLAAIQAGADYLVIGRPITGAADPGEAFRRICEEMGGSG